MTKSGLSTNRRTLLAGISTLAITSMLPRGAFAQETPVEGGTLTMVRVGELPGLLSFVNPSNVQISAKTTEGLLQYDFDMTPQPGLATEWMVSEDGLTYTFKLREGVNFHDGQPFTSKDVKYSIETIKQHHPRGRNTFKYLEAIEIPDDHTVILKLSKSTAYLLSALSATETAIVPAHVYGDADPTTHENNSAPIGTGPYKFKEWVRGSYASFEPNQDYWGTPAPYVDNLVLRFFYDLSAISVALETGDVDVGYRTPVPFRDVERLKALPTLSWESRGYEANPPNIIIAECNLAHEILKDQKVRQAIAHAIDRDAICRIVYFGNAKPSATPVVPAQQFHDRRPSPYGYDIALANQMLDEAGHARGGDGLRFTLTLDYANDDMRALAEFLRSALRQIGINIELRSQDLGTLVKRVYTDRDYALQLASLSNLFDPNVGVARLYLSSNYIVGVPFSNGTGYNNPRVDELIEAATTELDRTKRMEYWAEIQDIVRHDVPSFPLCMPLWETVSNVRAKNVTTNGEGFEGTLAQAYIG